MASLSLKSWLRHCSKFELQFFIFQHNFYENLTHYWLRIPSLTSNFMFCQTEESGENGLTGENGLICLKYNKVNKSSPVKSNIWLLCTMTFISSTSAPMNYTIKEHLFTLASKFQNFCALPDRKVLGREKNRKKYFDYKKTLFNC